LGPLSTALIVVLAASAAALLAAMIWLWPALARRGLAPVLARIALLGGLQFTVLGLVFVYVNRTYEFYASWSDLFGTSYVPGKIVAVQRSVRVPGGGRPGAGRPGAGGPGIGRPGIGRPGISGPGAGHPVLSGQGPAMVTLTSTPVTMPGVRRGAGGWLETVRFTGPVSGITTRGYVYMPDGYARITHPLPVIVVIAAQMTAGPGAAYGAPQIAATAAAQMTAGRLAPAIVAVLPAAVAGHVDQGCLDVPAGPQAATFFSQDLPMALVRAYRVDAPPSGWAVLGGVGGGYCALQLATLPSGPFAVAAVRPGTYAAPPGHLAPGAGTGLRSQDNLLWRLRHWPPPPVRILIAGPGHARQFQSLVRPPMSTVTGNLAAGSAPLVPVLDWIGHALAGRA
jgi:hypothetical protein